MEPKLEIPTHAVTRHTLRVRFCETDLMGIVHHANYLTYFEAARVEYLRRRGVTYASWAAQEAVHLPVISATLAYKRTAVFDDELVVEARLNLLTRVRIGFAYEIQRAGAGVTICEGTTVLACVGADHRPRRLPASVATVLCAEET